jgi:DNA-directed RNA polymerase subunit F
MIGKKTLTEKPVTLAEALEVLEKQKKGEELGYSQRLTYDYAQKFSKLTAKKAKDLAAELLKLGNLREHQVVTLVDLMPETKEDIQLIFAKERTRLEDKEIEKVLELIKKYRE